MCKSPLLRRLSGRNVKLSGEVKNDLGHSSTLLTSFGGLDRDMFTVFLIKRDIKWQVAVCASFCYNVKILIKNFHFVTVQESCIFKKKQLFALKYTLKHSLNKIN